MKKYEFETHLASDASVKVPHDIAKQIGQNQSLRVIILAQDTDEDVEWASFTSEQFLKGYADSDSIYDDLLPG